MLNSILQTKLQITISGERKELFQNCIRFVNQLFVLNNISKNLKSLIFMEGIPLTKYHIFAFHKALDYENPFQLIVGFIT